MVAAEPRSDNEPTLVEFLAQRARSSSDARLAADAVVGFTIGVASLLWRGPGWYALGALGLCFFCYGGWAIADRELREHVIPNRATRALGIARILAVIIGVAAGIMFVLGTMAIVFGRFIS